MKTKTQIAFLSILQLTLIVQSASNVVYLDSATFSTKDKNEKDFASLPSEFPQITSRFEIEASNYKTIFEDLSRIVGFLPLVEQYALLYSINIKDETKPLFDFTKFMKRISYTNTDGEAINVVESEYRAMVKYIGKTYRRLAVGLGCFKETASTFSYKSKEDEVLLKNLYKNLETILTVAEGMQELDLAFLDVLFTNTLNKRKLLFKLTKKNVQDTDSSIDDYFIRGEEVEIYDKNKTIVGIKYSSDEIKDIVTKFKNYTQEYQKLLKQLNEQSLLSVLNIAQLQGCLNEKTVNYDSGKSSKDRSALTDFPYINPTINYKGSQIISVNDGNGTRLDQKTQNNYSLLYGFGLGTNTVPLNSKKSEIKLPLPANVKTAFQSIKTVCAGVIQLGEDVNNTHALIAAEMVSALNTLTYEQFEVDTSINISSLIPICIGGDNFAFYKKGDYNLKTNESVTCPDSDSATLAIVCYSRLFYVYTVKSDGKFDIKSYTGSLKNEVNYYNQIQGCFATFSSGGYLDKEMCRGPMTSKCGAELDYKCKRSGLYDFINEHPYSPSLNESLPAMCQGDNDTTCFEWINNNFILGGVAVKFTQFSSFAMTLQSQGEYSRDPASGEIVNPTKYHKNEFTVFLEGSDFSDSTYDKYSSLVNMDEIKNNTKVQFSDLLSDTDKAHYDLISGNEMIKCNMMMLVIVGIILLFGL